jgi:hypothetical protein
MASNNLRYFSGAVALLLTVQGHTANDCVATEEIERCRTIADVVDRLDCYDRIGRPETAPTHALEAPGDSIPEPVPMDQDSQDPESPVVAAEDTEYGELTDDVGLPKSADDYKPIPVTVVRCGQSNNRKWYFYFDNGQVWQYLGVRALRYRDCNTPGVLIEDGMGFALQMDADKAKLRVKRVR